MKLSPTFIGNEAITIPAIKIAKLRIHGGDGDEDGKTGQESELDDANQSGTDSGEPDSSGASTGESGKDGAAKSDGKSADIDSAAALEAALDKSKGENIKLKGQLASLQDQIEELGGKVDETDADKTQTEKDYSKLEKKYNKLTAAMTTTYMDASIRAGKFDWQNTRDVAKFVEADSIRVNLDTGEIEGLDLELKRIAKDKPYLLKPKKEDTSDNVDKGGSRQPPAPGSGQHPFGGAARQRETDNNKIRDKYKIGQRFGGM